MLTARRSAEHALFKGYHLTGFDEMFAGPDGVPHPHYAAPARASSTPGDCGGSPPASAWPT